MKSFLTVLAAAAFAAAAVADDKGAKMTSPLDNKVKGIDGKELDLAQYQGKVVLIVNVASECGYTPQYTGLQALYEKYGKDGLVVLGVPANEFGQQEPGSEADIKKFCTSKYKVTFPMTAKQVVKGTGQSPLYAALTAWDHKEVGWNFEKFLLNRKGEVVARYKSGVEPTGKVLTAAVEKELAAK